MDDRPIIFGREVMSMRAVRLATTIAIGVLFAVPVCAQTSVAASESTFGLNNGRYWAVLDDRESRSVYLAGVLDGYRLSTMNEDGVKGKYINIFSRGQAGFFSTVELADMLTSVYADVENINLPIAWTAMASMAIMRGETTRELVFPALRRYLSSIGTGGFVTIPVDIIGSARPK